MKNQMDHGGDPSASSYAVGRSVFVAFNLEGIHMRKTYVGLILLSVVVAILALGCSIAEGYPNPFVRTQEQGAGSITQYCLTTEISTAGNQSPATEVIEAPLYSAVKYQEMMSHETINNVGGTTQPNFGNVGGSPSIDLAGDIFGVNGEGGNILYHPASGNTLSSTNGGGQIAPANA